MKGKWMYRFMAFTLIISCLSGTVAAAAGGDTGQSSENTSATYDLDSYANEMLTNNYTNVSKGYTAPAYQGDTVVFPSGDSYRAGTGTVTSENYGYNTNVVLLELGDNADFQINVPETARYVLKFDYLSFDDAVLPAELSLKINGDYPFYEARRLLFESTWVKAGEKSYDRYGNEIVTVPEKKVQWESKYLTDASYRRSAPLELELKSGSNMLTLGVSEGSLLLGKMYLEKMPETAAYTISETAEGNSLITIQGEDFTYRNDSSIRAVSEPDAALKPYDTDMMLLNTVDKDSFKNPGQRVTYEFKAEKAGYYNIALNYKQSDKGDFPVFLDVAVDGKVPNTEFGAYPFMYTTKYKTVSLKDDSNNKLSVYLEEGIHTISFTINIDNILQVLEAVSRISSEVNDLSLEITKVAGTNKDKYRDLKLTKYIPGVQETLYGWADELDELADSMKIYNSKVKKIAVFSQAGVVSSQLRSLGKEPDELPYRVGELSTGINSITTCLANLLDALNKNQISIDRIYLYQEEAKLPHNPGIFTRAYLNVKRFLSSFFDQAYSISSVREEHLQVWVGRSRQYLDIMQKMIDEEFTPQTGIHVDLSLMPDAQKLVLANASGDTPDIATGINYAIPFDLGIRGATKDLTEFPDYKEVFSRYQPGLLIPSTIGDGIYAMPETVNFYALYYREDVLDKMGLKVPDTMEDVINMLPELQARGLNFFYPTAAMLAMRNFHGTTPLIFQNGGLVYEENGKTGINSENAIKGLTELTELFTIYNIPKDVPSFYQHFRNGDIPIGISDFNTYNLLVNAAPEIANSWKIALVPGTVTDSGEIVRYTAGGAESTIMFKSDSDREDKAWEFMKWWSSKEVQEEYGQTLQMTYGEEYIWCSANMEAFEALPVDSEDKKIFAEQASWIMETPRILGSYMAEREISNAYNNIVVDGYTLRQRVDKAVKTIDRETERKLEEFGYIKDGKVVKDYIVPNIDTVNKILGNTK